MKKPLLVILITFLCISCSACTLNNSFSDKPDEGIELTGQKPAEATPMPTPTPEPPKRAVILAVGDIMFHSPQIKEAFNNGTYDFTSSFEDIKTVIQSADVAIGNLETTVNTKRKPSGYPRFNAPAEVLDAIGSSGFDVLVTANNHSADTGEDGIISTVENIRQRGMIAVGTGEVGKDKYAIIERNGIKFGVLAYTSSTNGLPASEEMVNIVSIEKIKGDIELVKPMCDFLIVYIHTGTEYLREVEEDQQLLFRAVADAGADCVLGSHPHVARQSELYKTGEREVFINYSLGNFLSNQNDKYTDIGGMVQLSIVKHEGKVMLDGFEILPVYRLRYKDGDKTIRKVVLCSKASDYEHISDTVKKYIEKVSMEIGQLITVDNKH
ncbi:MAG: CapA family protein [Bacillota bacterium]